MNVLHEIIARRRARIDQGDFTQGVTVPTERQTPIVPFGTSPRGGPPDRFLICEIKRRSPSKGAIAEGLDAVSQATRYANYGVSTVSVLTERDYFDGSLSDLMDVKRRHPGLCVLRKDFLLEPEDIDVSYRAGADAVLLIAAALTPERLQELHERAMHLGMAALVEVHSADEAAAIAGVRPPFTGFNARDLETFEVDPVAPLRALQAVTWPTRAVYESGISEGEHAAFAVSSGFDGVLVGEAVVRNTQLIPELINNLGARRRPFWPLLFGRDPSTTAAGRPLVKVCGLTRASDAHLADELGADLLGFVFAPSRRRAEPATVAGIGKTRALKVGVVVTSEAGDTLEPPIRELLESGALDAIQLHGDETPEACYGIAFPYFKALRLESSLDADRIGSFRCPRVLVDAFSDRSRGGTGIRIADDLVRGAALHRPLWLAGGLGPDNIGEVIRSYDPELVDSSSGLEQSDGIKDPIKVRRFFAEIEAASNGERDETL